MTDDTDTDTDASGESESVTLEFRAAVQVANLLEDHYEMTEESDGEPAYGARHFTEAIRDRLPPFHRRFGPDYYCRYQGATFEPQEMDDGACPWCGRIVEVAE